MYQCQVPDTAGFGQRLVPVPQMYTRASPIDDRDPEATAPGIRVLVFVNFECQHDSDVQIISKLIPVASPIAYRRGTNN